jgi:hypothetical protein
MSPASYLTAPPRVAAASLAGNPRCYSRHVLFWLALAVFILAPAAALVFAVRRGLETWRAVKQLGRGAGEELDRISRASAEIELHLQAAARSGEKLDASLTRLSSSRRRLSVLTDAFADARASLTGAYPRK